MKLINYRPPIILAVILILGILVGYYGVEYSFMFWLIPITVISLYIIAFVSLSKHRINVLAMFVLSLVLFVVGMTTALNRVQNYNQNEILSDKYEFSGRVSDEISLSYDSKIYEIDHIKIDGKTYSTDTKGYLYISDTLTKGDVITGWGSVYNATQKAYFQDEILFSIYAYKYKKVSHIENVLDTITTKIEKLYRANMTEKSYPIALALFTGNTTKIARSDLTFFRLNGLAHIFAVSGLHIGFMYLLITFILKKLKCKPLIRNIITIIILLSYCMICGFKPSSVRAVIMCLFLMFASGQGVKYDGLNALFSSMIVVLLINVGNVFDVGFILSYSTVFGIITFSPVIKRILKFLPEKISGAISCSVSASMFSMPLCFYYFGYISPFGVLLNLVAIPVIGIVYYVLCISSIITLIIPLLGIILKFSAVIIEGFRYLIEIVDASYLAVYSSYSLVSCVTTEIALITISDMINLGKINKIISFITFTVVTCLNIILGVI